MGPVQEALLGCVVGIIFVREIYSSPAVHNRVAIMVRYASYLWCTPADGERAESRSSVYGVCDAIRALQSHSLVARLHPRARSRSAAKARRRKVNNLSDPTPTVSSARVLVWCIVDSSRVR